MKTILAELQFERKANEWQGNNFEALTAIAILDGTGFTVRGVKFSTAPSKFKRMSVEVSFDVDDGILHNQDEAQDYIADILTENTADLTVFVDAEASEFSPVSAEDLRVQAEEQKRDILMSK